MMPEPLTAAGLDPTSPNPRSSTVRANDPVLLQDLATAIWPSKE